MGSYDFKIHQQPLIQANPGTLEPAINDIQHRDCDSRRAQTVSGFVQLEIKTEALLLLITQKRLLIEDIHCLNRDSKTMVRQALLERLKSSLKPG